MKVDPATISFALLGTGPADRHRGVWLAFGSFPPSFRKDNHVRFFPHFESMEGGANHPPSSSLGETRAFFYVHRWGAWQIPPIPPPKRRWTGKSVVMGFFLVRRECMESNLTPLYSRTQARIQILSFPPSQFPRRVRSPSLLFPEQVYRKNPFFLLGPGTQSKVVSPFSYKLERFFFFLSSWQFGTTLATIREIPLSTNSGRKYIVLYSPPSSSPNWPSNKKIGRGKLNPSSFLGCLFSSVRSLPSPMTARLFSRLLCLLGSSAKRIAEKSPLPFLFFLSPNKNNFWCPFLSSLPIIRWLHRGTARRLSSFFP